ISTSGAVDAAPKSTMTRPRSSCRSFSSIAGAGAGAACCVLGIMTEILLSVARPAILRALLSARLCPSAGALDRSAGRRRALDRAAAKLDASTRKTRTQEMDALSELLRAVKLSGAMFYVAEASKPWRVRAPSAHDLGRYVAPNASHVIEFHLATQGAGYVRVGEETTPFSAGDLFMIPHGDPHEMGNGSGAELIDASKGLPA